ncbi:membrane protein [Microbacterium phage Morrigan]|nr:membrane protein [Microbacterium phage Morrigan]
MDETTDIPNPPHQPRMARDRAQYTRQQKGHSLILHLTLGALVLWIPAIYFSVSPNHYWHA